MAHEDDGIPVIGRIDPAGVGLLQASPPDHPDRRLEEWIASNLDAAAESGNENHWASLIKNLPAAAARARGDHHEGRCDRRTASWSRFQLAYKRGIAVVRLIDQALVQQAHIEELGLDVMDLIAVGNHRLVLNFSAVERLGSWIIGVVGNALRACAAGDGGRLKICGLDAPLAEIFEIVGMARDLEFHPTEADAIEGHWPEPSGPRPLPVDLLNVLLELGEGPPVCGGAPDANGAEGGRGRRRIENGRSPGEPAAGDELRASLRVEAGDEVRLVPVPGAGLLIGRDAQSTFRIGSAQVSKRHASVEVREGRLFLRDLESTNGTTINGRLIRGEERELSDGDSIRIGPVSCTVVLGPECGETLDLAGEPQGILLEDAADDQAAWTQGKTAEDIAAIGDEDPDHRIRVAVIEDVLILTPQFENLGDDESLAAVRGRLQSLYEADTPRRVVVNLEFVGHLSRRAIALLLSHHIRLDWAGGGLRICQAHARIIALLDQVRLTMLVDCYPTLDEAVLASWGGVRAGAGLA